MLPRFAGSMINSDLDNNNQAYLFLSKEGRVHFGTYVLRIGFQLPPKHARTQKAKKAKGSLNLFLSIRGFGIIRVRHSIILSWDSAYEQYNRVITVHHYAPGF